MSRLAIQLVAIGVLGSVGAALVFLGDSSQQNSGFLFFGLAVGFGGTAFQEWVKRPALQADTMDALHVELADRVARCCFDYEDPWKSPPKPRIASGLRKFAPVPPVIYPAVAAQLAVLPADARQAVVQFYFRLEMLRRDLKDTADSLQGPDALASPEDMNRISRRFEQALEPGLRALQALDASDRDKTGMENQAIGYYDEHGGSGAHPKGQPLRARLGGQRASADQASSPSTPR